MKLSRPHGWTNHREVKMDTVTTERTRDNAPAEVRDSGGLALSLWLTGAGETDCVLTAKLSKRCEEMEDALEYSARQAVAELLDHATRRLRRALGEDV